MANKNALWKIAKDGIKAPSLITGSSRGTHGMVKQILLLNSAIYGGYLLMSGPMGVQYKRFFTLDGSSSITSLPLCHFSHTSALQFAVNFGALYTVGHWHAKTFGCMHMTKVAGVSAALATVLGVHHVYKNNEQTIAGSNAMSAGLITYNIFKNPQWFTLLRIHPMIWMAALTAYAGFGNDKAAVGGIAGGYLAFLFL